LFESTSAISFSPLRRGKSKPVLIGILAAETP
jgi:hypothetical protein